MLISPPQFLGETFSPEASSAAAVIKICATAGAPPDKPLLSNVLIGSVAALTAAIPFLGKGAAEIHELREQLSAATRALEPYDQAAREMLMVGRWTRYRVWGLISGLSNSSHPALLQIVGAELIRGFYIGTPFRHSVAQKCEQFVRDLKTDEDEHSSRCHKYAHRLLLDAASYSSASSTPQNKKDLLVAARVAASLTEQFNPRNLLDRAATNTIREMTGPELRLAMHCLREGVAANDPLSIVVSDVFFQGLPLDIALDVPFFHSNVGDWAAVQDLQEGVIKIDLSRVLPGLASARPGHVPASQILVRPYPEILVEAKQKLAARKLDARCLRDLLKAPSITSRNPVPGMSTDASIMPSIARLLHARGTIAIETGIDRTLAAFLVCDFTKIGRAKHHYVSISREEIWKGAEQYFAELGWGRPVAVSENNALAVGSMVMPTAGLVRAIDDFHLKRLASARIGKRYTSESLLNHHNAFATACALRTALFTSARKATAYAFTSAGFQLDAEFATLIDKRLGFLDGLTPIPIPSILHEQIALVHAHLRCLIDRLTKLGWSTTHPVFARCEAIERLEPASLYFKLTEDDIQDLGSRDLFDQLAPPIDVNGDALRHFVPNELRNLGLPSILVDAAERHQVQKTTRASASADAVQYQWLAEVAQKIDLIALRLGLLPIQGLSKGRRHAR